jgi:hypothetical protein
MAIPKHIFMAIPIIPVGLLRRQIMKIKTLIAASLTATLLGTGFSYAQTAPVQPQAQVRVMNEAVAQMPEVQALIEELMAQGYTSIEIRRTLLGRAKITASGPAGTREVVMSTATGEVMRDMAHGAAHGEGNQGMGEGNHEGGHNGEGSHDGGNMDDMGGNMGGGSQAGDMSGGASDMGGNMVGSMGGGMGGN